VGTDLWFAGITKVAGAALLQRQRRVDWQVVRRLWMGSLPVSVITLVWMHYSGVGQAKPKLILVALGWALLVTSFAMIFKTKTHAFAQTLRKTAPERFISVQPILTIAAGVILGFLVTLTSVSAGALGTAMLLYLYPFRMTPARLVGTDIMHAVPLAFVAGIGHMILGDVNVALLGNLLIGSIPGVLLGSLFGGRVPEALLRAAIALVLAVVAAKLLIP